MITWVNTDMASQPGSNRSTKICFDVGARGVKLSDSDVMTTAITPPAQEPPR
ncbi:hypothetical protein K443DRAFT_4056 [Laccaria amethystina LaAM-08-1]|uniref:Uncharacterized protein n=1 Tax=Laccaria amethystina LaAM-08-1 TaxID=1095629 RepID=A0A0C9WZJ5_9AGAR|nr:hypothetical protein K443DRAFT_4056 [Laccaria amethystina LaAM-08-1]